MIKDDIKLSMSAMRKFNNVFNDKQKRNILNEAIYFSNIYTTVSIEKLIEYSINKHLKVKIYNRYFCDINKDVMEYKRSLMTEYKKTS